MKSWKRCVECGKTFYSNYEQQIVCSAECADAWASRCLKKGKAIRRIEKRR